MDTVSIRLPYKHLKEAEVELVGLDDHTDQIDRSNSGVSDPRSDAPASSDGANGRGLKTLILASMVAAGVQFGWALQLSLLTPYVQTLGIDHAFSSFIWLCGPITGLVVQPCVGIWSDKCYSKYGRRRPFILIGSLMIALAVTIIGFSADIGYVLGDTREHCRTYKGTRTRAAIVFVIGFWMLDLANNTVQGPARALLADLSGPEKCNSANAIFCSWMALGNILGFSSGASGNWHRPYQYGLRWCVTVLGLILPKYLLIVSVFMSSTVTDREWMSMLSRWFPFLTSRACCEACGNLKAAFLVAVCFLTLCTAVTIYFAEEVPLVAKPQHHISDSAPLLNGAQRPSVGLSDMHSEKPIDDHVNGISLQVGNEGTAETSMHQSLKPEEQNQVYHDGPGAVLVNLLTSLRHLPPGMHSVLLVMALCWLSWFPFFLFDTDWMGREVYHGDPKGNETSQKAAYENGVREGAFGLLINSVVLGISSFLIEPMCQRIGARLVWAVSNFIIFVCMAGTAVISLFSSRKYSDGIQHVIVVNGTTRVAALVIFAVLGFPLAITYSVPFSVTAELTSGSGGGQGLAIGVLNLAIVIPQMIVSLGAGPWDALFGGGNIPAFVLASIFAFAAGTTAILKLPKLSGGSYNSPGIHGFG